MGMMRSGLPKGEERNKQKEVLRKEFQDYNPIYHDAFVEKYNKQQDNKASNDYHKERGFQNGRQKAQQEIANKWPVLNAKPRIEKHSSGAGFFITDGNRIYDNTTKSWIDSSAFTHSSDWKGGVTFRSESDAKSVLDTIRS